MTMFAPLVAVPQLETAAVDQLRAWLPAYVAEVERQMGLDARFIELPRSYQSASQQDVLPEEQSPAILVVSPGTDGDPERINDMTNPDAISYASWFQLSVVAGVHSVDEVSARALAGYYAAAIRGVMVQRPTIDGFTRGTVWSGEEIYGNPDTARNRSRAACVVHFRTRVEGLVTPGAGPTQADLPPDDPYAPWPDMPVVRTVDVVYENVIANINGTGG